LIALQYTETIDNNLIKRRALIRESGLKVKVPLNEMLRALNETCET